MKNEMRNVQFAQNYCPSEMRFNIKTGKLTVNDYENLFSEIIEDLTKGFYIPGKEDKNEIPYWEYQMKLLKKEDTPLKKMRESKGISQSELAKISGANLRTLQDYEQNRKDICGAKLETLLKICLALNCHLEEIVTDDNLKELIQKERELN